jgi:hypothetical protein
VLKGICRCTLHAGAYTCCMHPAIVLLAFITPGCMQHLDELPLRLERRSAFAAMVPAAMSQGGGSSSGHVTRNSVDLWWRTSCCNLPASKPYGAR